jgi:hypothetical protein
MPGEREPLARARHAASTRLGGKAISTNVPSLGALLI